MKSLLFACSIILLDAVGCGSRHYYDPDYLYFSAERITFEYQEGSKVITVSSNIKWNVTESGSWLEASPLSGQGDAEITITAQPNESTSGRSAYITIRGGDMESRVQVYQRGKTIADN